MTKNEALKAGVRIYGEGIACKNGHVCGRWSSTGRCVECQREARKKWGAAHPGEASRNAKNWYESNRERAIASRRAHRLKNLERYREYARKYLRNNREKVLKISKEWSLKNKERHAALIKLWGERNMDRLAARTAARRSRELNQTPVWASKENIYKIYEEAAKLRSHGFDVHVDHEIPLKGRLVSGLHVETNLKIIGARDNLAKGNRFLLDHEVPLGVRQ